MKTKPDRCRWRLAIFAVVCMLGDRSHLSLSSRSCGFSRRRPTTPCSPTSAGSKDGNFVRIAGVEVGKVKKITDRDDTTVYVEFAADDSVVLTEGTQGGHPLRQNSSAIDTWLSRKAPAGFEALGPGQTIPLNAPQPALDLDALIGGFRPLFRALDPDQANALTGQLIDAFQGQGPTISSFLAQTATLTNTLADRDQLIGEVINNLDTVLRIVGRPKQAVRQGSGFGVPAGARPGRAQGRTSATGGLHRRSAPDRSTDLLSQARPPLQNVVHETDRAAGIVVADHEYFDNLLEHAARHVQVLNRQGLYGDYLQLLSVRPVLKLNGKGGQPVYVKLAGQATGRCTPK